MAYYRECPTCGAHLDPGERCTECADLAKESAAAEAGTGLEKVKLEWKTPGLPARAPRMICPYR